MILNLGCGDERRDDAINIDLRYEAADVVADASCLPFGDGTVDEVVALDLLEHLPADQTHALLSEWRRVLCRGGGLTVKVPNLLAIFEMMLARPLPHHRRALIRNIYGGHRWGPGGAYDTHHTGWTSELLEIDLREAGFEVLANDDALNMTITARKR